MKNRKLLTGIAAVTMLTIAGSASVYAMPGDIKEAVEQNDYNAYEHVNSYSYYSDDDLIEIGDYYVATAEAMIRQSPFGTILGSVTPGQTYYVEAECSDCMWYKIDSSVSGYVYASYLVPKSQYVASTNNNTGSTQSSNNIRDLNMYMTVTDAPSVNVRTAPSASASIVTALSEGTEVHVTGNVLNAEWYQCTYKGQTVYICDDYLTPEFPQTMACTAQQLNVRASADGSSQVIALMNHGDKAKVTADVNGWLKFTMDNGTVGYVSDEYMSVVE